MYQLVLPASLLSSAAVRHAVTDPRVRPIIDRVTGAGQCAPLAGSSVTGLVSDGAGREEM
jgi:phage-related baseplate assembly protein